MGFTQCLVCFLPVSSLEAPSTGEEKLLFLHIPAGYPNYIPLIKIMQKKKKWNCLFFMCWLHTFSPIKSILYISRRIIRHSLSIPVHITHTFCYLLDGHKWFKKYQAYSVSFVWDCIVLSPVNHRKKQYAFLCPKIWFIILNMRISWQPELLKVELFVLCHNVYLWELCLLLEKIYWPRNKFVDYEIIHAGILALGSISQGTNIQKHAMWLWRMSLINS